ncbi:cysteine--tRNA ligase [Picosynechococcus sp. PCC 11901]|uniref:cysteine--tRNA ligase n=1 Tax=Picosynechococcus sp. PCC 11901 TaxID=2579791 RepID=UPI0010FC0A72|nr:cysteine--tRNA ligase [Picosynechococcus sp. PCC 11901]QCS48662.1 cysteine--tRNA ligase [Picosynechococcus sp. PCC 11901]
MSLSLYNTLHRRSEPFEPLEANRVRMYCCGITVYDYCHLGHARTCLIWDVVRRYLQWSGYEVHYIQNFTDIDDKILNRARAEKSSMGAIAEKFIEAYFEDMEALHIQPADEYPRATHSLDGIQKLIHDLEQRGFAYASQGDVYYAVRKFDGYGKLSGRKLEDMQAGASGRVTEDPDAPKKHDPFDFALWKAAKAGEPAWDSPWGSGRPGWHIECSAMVRDRLGETIDIHVGGSDLIFPHHENEIAQSEAATGQPLAKYWLHNGMVKVEGEKMSKSLGNFITIRELLEKYDPMAVRLFILQAHYTKPLDFTDEALTAATKGWETLNDALLFGAEHLDTNNITADKGILAKFKAIVDNDLNFSGGLAILFELAKELKKEKNILVHEGKLQQNPQILASLWLTLKELADILGFVPETKQQAAGLTDAEIEALIQQRKDARANKNYAEGDRLRDLLAEKGIVLVDKPGGITEWHRE